MAFRESPEHSHGRFAGIATVSLLDVVEATDRLERSVKDLGLLGVQVLSNVRGKPLDSPESILSTVSFASSVVPCGFIPRI